MNPDKRNPFGGKDAIVLQGYFDDSGNSPNEEFFIWAGFVGGGKTFGDLSTEWNAILSEGTRVPSWHTFTAHAHRDGQEYFGARISKDELIAKEDRLASLLAKFGHSEAITKVIVRIRRAEHQEHVVDALKKRPAKNERLGIPQAFVDSLARLELLPLHEIVRGLAVIAIKLGAYADYVQMFFEDREGGADWQDSVCQSVRMFRRLEEPEFRQKIGMVTFVPGGSTQYIRVPALEMADMLAWHVRRRSIPGAPLEPCWPCFEMIKGGIKTVEIAEMKAYVERLQRGERPWKILKHETG